MENVAKNIWVFLTRELVFLTRELVFLTHYKIQCVKCKWGSQFHTIMFSTPL